MDLDGIFAAFLSFYYIGLFLTKAVNPSSVLADVLRNCIMQNTSAVFEKSYQAEHIRVNSLRLRFMPLYPDEEGWRSGPLERAMRTMILKSDPNAPVEPSTEYLQSFERRLDVSTLRRDIKEAKAAKDRETWRPLYFKVNRLIGNLSKQAVAKMRTAYFERVDRLRALGQSTSKEAPTAAAAPSRANHVRLCHCWGGGGGGGELSSKLLGISGSTTTWLNRRPNDRIHPITRNGTRNCSLGTSPTSQPCRSRRRSTTRKK